MTDSITTYLAIDIETTGLDPNGAILEVAAKVLDQDLRTIMQYHSTIECSRSLLLAMPDIVMEMHTKTGLVAWPTPGRPHVVDGAPLAAVYRELHSIVQDAVDQRRVQLTTEEKPNPDARLIALGASLHGVDRPFLHQHMPLVDALLSHRHCDSSSMKVALPMLEWPKEDESKKHTAGDDIDHAIECVRFIRGIVELALDNATGCEIEGTALRYKGTTSARLMTFGPNYNNEPRGSVVDDLDLDVPSEVVVDMNVTKIDDTDPTNVVVSYTLDGGEEMRLDLGPIEPDAPSDDTADAYAAAVESGTDSTPVALADSDEITDEAIDFKYDPQG